MLPLHWLHREMNEHVHGGDEPWKNGWTHPATHIALVTSSVKVPTGSLLSPNQASCFVCSKSGDRPLCPEKGTPTGKEGHSNQ